MNNEMDYIKIQKLYKNLCDLNIRFNIKRQKVKKIEFIIKKRKYMLYAKFIL